ncbi:MAG: FtsW/RodA/SpoVE family cell cycle protein, partial [Clostridia bacterium]|nr:FtsW/RodA/SpoVE family cell cycle protein [Clostridia bacterium]
AYYEGKSTYFLRQHIIHILAGSVFAFIAAFVMTPKLGKLLAAGTYLVALLLLGLVLVIGFTSGGARRWINVAGISVQPSEIAKTGLILSIAAYMSTDPERFAWKKGNRWKGAILRGFIVPLAMTGIFAVLILLEKHISATVITVLVGGVTMLLGGTNILMLVIAAGGAGGVLYWVMTTWSYAKKRINTLFNRGSDVSGADWQTTEGLYAMGTGGWFGLGLGNSRLKYGYVSEPQNDFIFAVICEELGFIGTAIILILFFALRSRGLRLAQKCTDRFCAVVIAGITFKTALHVLLNVAVVCAVIPNTGISLPFFSSGGSATMMQIFDAGILLGCSRYCRD